MLEPVASLIFFEVVFYLKLITTQTQEACMMWYLWGWIKFPCQS